MINCFYHLVSFDHFWSSNNFLHSGLAFYKDVHADLKDILIISAHDISIIDHIITPAYVTTIVLVSLTDGSLTYFQEFSLSRNIRFWMEQKGQCQGMRINISYIFVS